MKTITNPGSYIAEMRRDWYAIDCLIAAGCHPISQVQSDKEPGGATTPPARGSRPLEGRSHG